MSIWDRAVEETKNWLDQQDEAIETTMMVLGSKHSGKTSIINRFLDKETEIVKPTVALDYTFGRRTKTHSDDKDVTHIFELGGGTSMLKLLSNCIDDETLLNLSLVIVVDLSQPASVVSTIDTILTYVLSCIERCISQSSSDTLLKDNLRSQLKERLKGHSDASQMEPFPIPVTIIGGKYDQFVEKIDLELRRVTCRTLRFLAHYYHASLLFFTTIKQKDLTNKLRTHLTVQAFNVISDQSLYQPDVTLPLLITAGNDSFQNIGEPPVDKEDYNRLAAKTPLESWKYAFYNYFPDDRRGLQQKSVPPDPTVDPSDPNKYAEPMVDKARIEKEEELDRYKRASERRMRDLAQQAINEGVKVNLQQRD